MRRWAFSGRMSRVINSAERTMPASPVLGAKLPTWLSMTLPKICGSLIVSTATSIAILPKEARIAPTFVARINFSAWFKICFRSILRNCLLAILSEMSISYILIAKISSYSNTVVFECLGEEVGNGKYCRNIRRT